MNKCLINMKGKVAKISIRGRHLIINHCGSAPWGSRPIQHVLTNSILFRLRITNTINYPWPFIQLSWANIGARPVSKIVVYDAVTFFFMVCIQRDLRLVENMHKLWAVWISSDLSVRSIRQCGFIRLIYWSSSNRTSLILNPVDVRFSTRLYTIPNELMIRISLRVCYTSYSNETAHSSASL